jgi:transposase
MLGTLPASVSIYLATQPVDMRKGFDGLCGLIRQWDGDLYSGHLFAFVSRRGDRIKILTWDRGGFVLWYKRLERGRFVLPAVCQSDKTLQLDAGQLMYLLDGVDFSRVKRRISWQPKIVKEKIHNHAQV